MATYTFQQNDIYTIGYSGESNDAATETISALLATTKVTPSTTFVGPVGTYSLGFDMTANGNKALVQGSANLGQDWGNSLSNGGLSGILVLSFRAALSGAPTSEVGVFTSDTTTGGGTSGTSLHHVGIGTDQKLYFYNIAGTQLAVSTSTIPTAGAMREVCIVYDGINHATTWVKVYMDGVEEMSFDSGFPFTAAGTAVMFGGGARYPYWGEYLAGGTNRGCTLYLDDFILRFSSTASEAPHLTAYPRIKIAGSVIPDGDGTYTDYTAVPAGNRYTNVNSNDGGTTSINTIVQSKKDTVKSSTANPMAGGSTVLKAQLRQVRLKAGAGKNDSGFLRYGTLGSEAKVSSYFAGGVSTSYTGRCCMFLWQDGDGATTLPVFADAAANASAWGVESDASGTISDTLTFMPGPEWVHYTATLPLGTAPASIVYPRRSTRHLLAR